MASENVKIFNDLNFESEVLKAPGVVLVDFTAAWCGPCKRLAPIVQELADELSGRVTVGKLDVDEAQATAQRFGIRSVPTVMVFKDGTSVGQQVGLTSKAKLLELIGPG
jgi:thioredoxin 1